MDPQANNPNEKVIPLDQVQPGSVLGRLVGPLFKSLKEKGTMAAMQKEDSRLKFEARVRNTAMTFAKKLKADLGPDVAIQLGAEGDTIGVWKARGTIPVKFTFPNCEFTTHLDTDPFLSFTDSEAIRCAEVLARGVHLKRAQIPNRADRKKLAKKGVKVYRRPGSPAPLAGKWEEPEAPRETGGKPA